MRGTDMLSQAEKIVRRHLKRKVRTRHPWLSGFVCGVLICAVLVGTFIAIFIAK